MVTKTITNQCHTEMVINDYKEHGIYFTGIYEILSSPVMGIRMPGSDVYHTINLQHEGNAEAVDRLTQLVNELEVREG